MICVQNRFIRRKARPFTVMLDVKEERRLIALWQDKKDSRALEKIIKSYTPLVESIAWNFYRGSIPHEDLVQEGMMGLQEAVLKFKMDFKNRLGAYARHCIGEKMRAYITGNAQIAHALSDSMLRKQAHPVNALKNKRNIHGPLNADQVREFSDLLGIDEKRIALIEQHLSPDTFVSLDVSPENNDAGWDRSGTRATSVREIPDSAPDPEELCAEKEKLKIMRVVLQKGLERLSPREKDIVIKRVVVEPKHTFAELGAFYGISRERVRQIEVRAFEKLRKVVKKPPALREY